MTSMSPHVAEFIATVITIFPAPAAGAKEDAWVGLMERHLRHQPANVLARAAEIIVRTRDPRKRDERFFPSPVECTEYCDRAKRDLGLSHKQLSFGERDQSEWAGWRRARANEFLRDTALGRQAASEGWAVAYHNFVRREQRQPSPAEAGRLRTDSKEIQALAKQCAEIHKRAAVLNDSGAGLSGALSRFARTFIDLERQMADYALANGPAPWTE